ncbi:hypothetical protein BGX27_008258 [Mortierella sp. AM989]|nr:hypothetical protein BGX27_008258 [Mortierella sp. AM989]
MSNDFTQPREAPMRIDPTNSSYPSSRSPRSSQSPGATLPFDNQSSRSHNFYGVDQQGQYSASAPPLPYDPLHSSGQPSPYRAEDPRANTNTSGYQPTSPMQGPRSPSLDNSQPPMSPLPPYIARPPTAMPPPHYYHEVLTEIQGTGQMRPMEMSNRAGGYGHNYDGSTWTPERGDRSNMTEEDMLFRSAGYINQERNHDKNMWQPIDDKKDQEAVRNLLLEGLAERWGAEFDPSYNQDVTDIYSYYVQRHHATVIVLELQENSDNSVIIGCGILLPLPAEDVYGAWCDEPPSARRTMVNSSKEPKLCRMIRLSISNQYRGKGYAKSIIQRLIGVAREEQFDRILVETQTAWASAVQMYKSAGFRIVETGEEYAHFEYEV